MGNDVNLRRFHKKLTSYVMINGIKFFWLTNKQWCDDMTNGQGHDFTTDFQSDYP